MTRRKLPIGMQTFRKVREERCYYVDKTAYIRRLLDEGEHYFLSRPRRFGKSLFLDTCKELFEGNEPLFEGLAIHDRWNWSVRRPVLRLSFGSGNFKEPGYLHTNLMAQLDVLEEQLGVGSRYDTAAERFGHLVRTSSARAGRRAVILVDEYDKPILDALDTPEVARAPPTGSRPARPPSWWTRCSGAASVRWRWTGWSAARRCCRRSTWTTCRPRRCCSRPAT